MEGAAIFSADIIVTVVRAFSSFLFVMIMMVYSTKDRLAVFVLSHFQFC